MDNAEIILNLWYVRDELGFIYSLRARAYIGRGTDEEKMALLKKYASIDYLFARIFPLPAKFNIDGKPVYHMKALSLLDSPIAIFEEAIQAMQRDLPVQTPLDIPKSPIVCLTPLLGDDEGHIRVQIDKVGQLGNDYWN